MLVSHSSDCSAWIVWFWVELTSAAVEYIVWIARAAVFWCNGINWHACRQICCSISWNSWNWAIWFSSFHGKYNWDRNLPEVWVMNEIGWAKSLSLFMSVLCYSSLGNGCFSVRWVSAPNHNPADHSKQSLWFSDRQRWIEHQRSSWGRKAGGIVRMHSNWKILPLSSHVSQ